MHTAIKVLTIVAAAASFSFLGAGCKSDQKANGGDHPSADHPRGEHPQGEHPQGEHPQGEHPR